MNYSFDPESHIYSVAGRELPGCSRVLDHSGMVAYKFVRADILERKSALGREAHRCTVMLDRGTLDWTTVDDAVTPYIEAWAEFKRVMGFAAELHEYQCIAEVNGMKYGMQLDVAGRIKKRDTIVEKKICTTILPHHKVQTAGYSLGLPKKGIGSALARFATRLRVIAQLLPNGHCNPIICEDNEDAQAFISALWVSTWKKRFEKIYREEAAP